MLLNAGRRFTIIKIVVAAAAAVLLVRLFNMQIIEGGAYRQMAGARMGANLTEAAPRGEIFDRYGTPLVTNRECYSVTLFKTDMENREFNKMLLDVINILEDADVELYDTFPISSDAPYRFVFESDEARAKWFADNLYKSRIDESMSADAVMQQFIHNIYDIDESYSDEDIRRITGIRYEAESHGFSSVMPYTVADDVDINVVAKIKENINKYSGVCITNNYKREFADDTAAAHIIGRIGKLNAEEYEANKDKGYSYNDIIGKQGIEKSAERYLRGENGYKGTELEVDGKKVSVINKKAAVPGNNVVLTLDMKLQKTVEKSLEQNITAIRSGGGEKTGGDCSAGAAVVIDVRNGDVLACASYPTYDISRFNEDYEELITDEARPLLNRAVSGTYTPGSTFKPLTAIAALETGAIKPDEKITDEGVYKHYEGYQPACWLWNESRLTHGSINVSKAIEQSCNYFFYETGRRTGIDTIDDYAGRFGLGKLTGIELPEETAGAVASAESKKKAVYNVIDQSWFGGDTLQAAIGQSYNLFTPVQLANYAAAVANGGTRYKVSLIKSVRSPVDGHEIVSPEPVVEEKIDMKPETLNAVRMGMRNVVDEGSASAIFRDYGIAIGGKTGTAQLGNNQSNNALFVAFAPFDEPEIAVCVVLEHGVKGANAAYVAKDIFDSYFAPKTETGNEKTVSEESVD